MTHRLLRPLLLAAAVASSGLAPLAGFDDVHAWEARVAQTNRGGLPLVAQNTLPDQDSYSWAGYQWVQGYLSLAQATGDGRYMDFAKDILEHMLANRDDIRFAGRSLDAPYYYAPTHYLFHAGKPAPGWRRNYGRGKAVAVLTDGRICEIFLRWCELARRSFPNYEDDIARYLDRVHETIEMHQPSFREIGPVDVGPSIYTPNPARADGGFRHWWHNNSVAELPPSDEPKIFSGQLPINHSATMARAMLAYDRLRGTTLYQDKVRMVVNYFLNSLDPARPDKAVWEYDPVNSRRQEIEDIDHAGIIMPLVIEAYRDGGFGVTGEHIRRLIATYHGCFDPATGAVRRFIDGSDDPNIKPHDAYRVRASVAYYGWLWLSQFDPTILDKARRAYEVHFAPRNDSSGFVMGGWANLIYWEMVRDGTAVIHDRAPAP
jgi:hypothetical protein